eukprot:CAMPEP_0171070116 /NCGR_PEP_ID=MMETSP0766_2-20121228/9550_1 /TAXON_ID=439317 /ORGANISM="Gambierdiscus australes, Strain CAWD 149" /LENGTH=557 /DNA_ID=CAMNT_0011526553 /DNA_START=59 /DNA_END=1732 /DNA_ORIENTATION=-
MVATNRCLLWTGLSVIISARVAASSDSRSLLSNLGTVLGTKQAKAIEQRASALQESLHAIFATVPKNNAGMLERPVVRYVLHRFFMQLGWSIRGLEPAGQAWSSGSPTDVLREQLPKQAVDLLESRFDSDGFALQDAAVLAAVFKHLVHGENVARLQASYRAHQLQHGATLDEESAQRVLDTYLAGYVLGKNLSSMSADEIHGLEWDIAKRYGNWRKIQELARDIMRSLLGNGGVSLPGLKRVVDEIGERFGREENSECQARKHELMEIERQGTGRVRLANFYRIALHEGKWHFGESTGYLRQLGCLDESSPDDLQVIIPNYVNSKSNCVDPSAFYSVCCLNECDGLLESLERDLRAVAATPTEIAALVAALPSATVPANRTLPAVLIRRLQAVAESHGGLVPLHGRLFAQWMHHAYPRECPFPHISGTTSPLRVEDWAAEPGNEVVAAKEEMLQHISAPRPPPQRHAFEGSEAGECAPWMEEEELLAPYGLPPAAPGSVRESMQMGMEASWLAVAAVASLAALASGVTRLLKVSDISGAGRSHGGKQAQEPVIYSV